MLRFPLRPSPAGVAMLLFSTCLLCPALHAALPDRPMPNQEELRQRALATYARTADQREKYECRERQVQNDLDSKGRVKKTSTVEQDFFFSNGRPILREVLHDGKPLDDSARKKQDDRVHKEIAAAEKTAKKQNRDADTFSSANFLRMTKLANERRVLVAGRPTIVFDVVDDPDRKSSDVPQKIIAAMRGTMSIDEETGHVQDIDVTGVRDVKIAGGLLASIHKGFQLHAIFAPQTDGVWLAKALYGSGDARVGLFFHPFANFRSDVLSCHLFQVESDQVVKEIEKK